MNRRSEFNTQTSYALRLGSAFIHFQYLIRITLVLTNAEAV